MPQSLPDQLNRPTGKLLGIKLMLWPILVRQAFNPIASLTCLSPRLVARGWRARAGVGPFL